MKIRLTKEQFDYVMENYFSPHGIKNVVYEKVEENNHAFYDVELNGNRVADMEDWSIDECCVKGGFDQNYDITPFGKMMEALTDELHDKLEADYKRKEATLKTILHAIGKQRLYLLMDAYLQDDIYPEMFCEGVHLTLERKPKLNEMEEKAFYELSEVANKSEQDFKDSPGCYFDDKKLKEKALEIKNRLNAYGMKLVLTECGNGQDPFNCTVVENKRINGRRALLVKIEPVMSAFDYGWGLHEIKYLFLLGKYGDRRIKRLNKFPIDVVVVLPEDFEQPMNRLKRWSEMYCIAWGRLEMI